MDTHGVIFCYYRAKSQAQWSNNIRHSTVVVLQIQNIYKRDSEESRVSV